MKNLKGNLKETTKYVRRLEKEKNLLSKLKKIIRKIYEICKSIRNSK